MAGFGGPNPGARDWFDVEKDYRTNEIAINWNAALIYALASNLPDRSARSGE
ncbi:MAG: glycoside hydrolase family 9 protein [Opitutaceae bacterium]